MIAINTITQIVTLHTKSGSTFELAIHAGGYAFRQVRSASEIPERRRTWRAVNYAHFAVGEPARFHHGENSVTRTSEVTSIDYRIARKVRQ